MDGKLLQQTQMAAPVAVVAVVGRPAHRRCARAAAVALTIDVPLGVLLPRRRRTVDAARAAARTLLARARSAIAPPLEAAPHELPSGCGQGRHRRRYRALVAVVAPRAHAAASWLQLRRFGTPKRSKRAQISASAPPRRRGSSSCSCRETRTLRRRLRWARALTSRRASNAFGAPGRRARSAPSCSVAVAAPRAVASSLRSRAAAAAAAGAAAEPHRDRS